MSFNTFQHRIVDGMCYTDIMYKENHKQKAAAYSRIYMPILRAKQRALKRAEQMKKYDPLKTISPIDLSYIAGLFDGEGCVSIVSGSHPKQSPKISHTLHISISQKDRSVLEYVHDLFKLGNICYDGKNKKCSRWYASSINATEILKILLPYLRVKRAQAEVGIEFKSLVFNRDCRAYPLSNIDIEEREKLKNKMQNLNQRRLQ